MGSLGNIVGYYLGCEERERSCEADDGQSDGPTQLGVAIRRFLSEFRDNYIERRVVLDDVVTSLRTLTWK